MNIKNSEAIQALYNINQIISSEKNYNKWAEKAILLIECKLIGKESPLSLDENKTFLAINTPKKSLDFLYDWATLHFKENIILENELSKILRAFYPLVNSTVKKDDNISLFKFLRKFVGKEDVRYCLNYIYVKDGYAHASNGHVAVKGRTNLPDGYYCPKTMENLQKDNKGNDLTVAIYPDFNRAFRDTNKMNKGILDIQSEKLYYQALYHSYYLKINDNELIRINSTYLEDALFDGYKKEYEFYYVDSRSSIQLHSNDDRDISLCIMPIRI